jgi:hypothetical protein
MTEIHCEHIADFYRWQVGFTPAGTAASARLWSAAGQYVGGLAAFAKMELIGEAVSDLATASGDHEDERSPASRDKALKLIADIEEMLANLRQTISGGTVE